MEQKSCIKCGKDISGKIRNVCGYCRVKQYRHHLKSKAIEYLGGKCERCGFDKHPAAMQFHHKDPIKKSFTISSHSNKSWSVIKTELDKCELLCANCHAIEHSSYLGA